jgi:transcriptional regulator with XRE-family HTH domain
MNKALRLRLKEEILHRAGYEKQVELAKAAGVSHPTVGLLLRGVVPGKRSLAKISATLYLTPQELAEKVNGILAEELNNTNRRGAER